MVQRFRGVFIAAVILGLCAPVAIGDASAQPKSKSRMVKITGTGVLGGVVPDWAIVAFATFELPRATAIPRDMARPAQHRRQAGR